MNGDIGRVVFRKPSASARAPTEGAGTSLSRDRLRSSVEFSAAGSGTWLASTWETCGPTVIAEDEGDDFCASVEGKVAVAGVVVINSCTGGVDDGGGDAGGNLDCTVSVTDPVA